MVKEIVDGDELIVDEMVRVILIRGRGRWR